MGKKSKRKSSSNTPSNKTTTKKDDKPTLLDETSDNLKFEDPFEDQYEKEDFEEGGGGVGDDDNDNEMDVEETNNNNNNNVNEEKVESWNPLTSTLDPGTKLEVDESAYKMHHSLTPEWPALSFDILRDTYGDSRTRFPHSMIVASGSQADRADRNKLTIMKLSDLSRTGRRQKTEKEMEDEILGEEYDKEEDSDDDDEEEEEEDDIDEHVDPVLEHFSLRHNGAVNRVRAMPQKPEVVATWSDTGAVNLYNIRGVLDSFNRSAGLDGAAGGGGGGARKINRDPFFVYKGHSTEGYAMDWSPVNEGHLATGDCDGNIHLWSPTEGYTNYSNSSFKVTSTYGPSTDENIDNPSVEDIQWSPTEKTVLAAAECGGYVKIYDTRCGGRAMLSNKIHENSSDVNVISWNPIISNLLASGGDDGLFSVWDLRNFQSKDGPPQPLARFTCHKKPITSLEWHPSDESMIVVSDEDGTYIYDLSIEEDEEEEKSDMAGVDGSIPPQLLFVHCGSESTKEIHWHPQITSLVMTTALSGYSVFIPSNL
jgi:ribosome assembly protein RRB1